MIRLNNLCETTLSKLYQATEDPKEFYQAALEASRSDLIADRRFHKWFCASLSARHDVLLGSFDMNVDAEQLCSTLVSAFAMEHNKLAKRTPPRPQTLAPTTPSPPISTLAIHLRMLGRTKVKHLAQLGSRDELGKDFYTKFAEAHRTLHANRSAWSDDEVVFTHSGIEFRKRVLFPEYVGSGRKRGNIAVDPLSIYFSSNKRSATAVDRSKDTPNAGAKDADGKKAGTGSDLATRALDILMSGIPATKYEHWHRQ